MWQMKPILPYLDACSVPAPGKWQASLHRASGHTNSLRREVGGACTTLGWAIGAGRKRFFELRVYQTLQADSASRSMLLLGSLQAAWDRGSPGRRERRQLQSCSCCMNWPCTAHKSSARRSEGATEGGPGLDCGRHSSGARSTKLSWAEFCQHSDSFTSARRTVCNTANPTIRRTHSLFLA